MTPDPAAPTGEPTPRRRLLGPVLLFVIVIAVLLIGISPAPYVVERPGPVYDTLGTTTVDDDEVPVIEITGAPSYPTEGRLDLLTVYIDGSRERPIDWFSVLAAWLDPRRAILPIDRVFPVGESDEESDERSAIAMQGSQQSATAVALTQLGIDYDSTVVVALVGDDAPADGVLQVDDEILRVGDTPVASDAELRAAIADAGLGAELELEIRRDRAEQTVTLTTEARSASDPTPVIGIVPTVRFGFPFEVEIHLQRVGGASAGMMFALGIYDTLTPGSLTGGEHIAGTGTVDPDGRVGVIGGVQQKMYAARDAGADWFFVADGNCSEVVGHVPDGLRVVAVSTFADAVDAARAVGTGEGVDTLATCR